MLRDAAVCLQFIKIQRLDEGVSTVFSVLKLAGAALTFTMDWRLCTTYVLLLGCMRVQFTRSQPKTPTHIHVGVGASVDR
jgi:hypothetical protein